MSLNGVNKRLITISMLALSGSNNHRIVLKISRRNCESEMNPTSSLELFTVNTSSNSSLSTNNNSFGVGTSYSQSYGIPTSKIVRSVILCIIMLLSIFGNSLILTAIRTTPSLMTKTNKILASLAISDLWAGGIVMLYIVPFTLITSLNPCAYRVSRVMMLILTNSPTYASCFNLIIVAIDRYVAIVHPLKYEMRMTDTVISCMIAAAWLISLLCSSSFTLWLINADMTECNIVPLRYFFINPCIYMLVGTVVTILYMRILLVAWHHHVAIQQSTTAVASLPVNAVQSNVLDSDSISIVAQQQQQHKYQQKVSNYKSCTILLPCAFSKTPRFRWYKTQELI